MDKKLEEDTMSGTMAHPSLKVMPELQLVSEFKDELQSGEPSQQPNMMNGEVIESVQDCVGQVSSKDFTALFILMVHRGFLEILPVKRSFLYYWRGSESKPGGSMDRKGLQGSNWPNLDQIWPLFGRIWP